MNLRDTGPGVLHRSTMIAVRLRHTALFRIAATAAAVLLFGHPATADEVGDFYRGKTVTLYLGYPPGGAYDIYARLIGRHLTRHMPGNPQFVVRHKPGAASLNLANELYTVLPRDGSVIGMFARSVALGRLLGREGTNYDPWRSTGSAAPTTKSRSAPSGMASACARPRSFWRARSCSPPMRRARN